MLNCRISELLWLELLVWVFNNCMGLIWINFIFWGNSLVIKLLIYFRILDCQFFLRKSKLSLNLIDGYLNSIHLYLLLLLFSIFMGLELASHFSPLRILKFIIWRLHCFLIIIFWLCFNLVIVKVISMTIDLDHWYSSLLIYKAASWCKGGLDLASQGVFFFSFSYW